MLARMVWRGRARLTASAIFLVAPAERRLPQRRRPPLSEEVQVVVVGPGLRRTDLRDELVVPCVVVTSGSSRDTETCAHVASESM